MNTTLDYITTTSNRLFKHTDLRIKFLYEFLIELCVKGNDQYYRLKTQYHNIDHFLSSVEVFVDIYDGIVKESIITKDPNNFFCGVIATLYHDIGFLKNKDEKLGTGAQYINCHVDRGCEFVSKNFSEILTQEEQNKICKLIKTTDYFKPNYNVGLNELGACVALADWLSQMSDELYVDKLERLYKEFDEYQRFNKINMYNSFEDMVHKTPGFWNKLVKPMLHNHYYNLQQYGTIDYVSKIEQNINILVERYELNVLC